MHPRHALGAPQVEYFNPAAHAVGEPARGLMTETKNHAAFIWSVADLLRGDYKQSEYGKVILPLTVLRRLDCVIDPVKADMLTRYGDVKDTVDNFGPILDRLTDIKGLWNTSRSIFRSCSMTPTTSPTTCVPTLPGSHRRSATSSRTSISTPRSPASTSRTCCTWCSANSRRSTCTPTPSRT